MSHTHDPKRHDDSSGPDVQEVAPDANTDDETLDVNPEIHQSATDDLSDPGERPQVDEEIARGRGRTPSA